jgi:serine acetyltransferase
LTYLIASHELRARSGRKSVVVQLTPTTFLIADIPARVIIPDEHIIDIRADDKSSRSVYRHVAGKC